jgi:hypothetical protein
MSFLKQFGIELVSNSEPRHGASEDKPYGDTTSPPKTKLIVDVHQRSTTQLVGLDLAKNCWIKRDANRAGKKYRKLNFLYFDSMGDALFEDPPCDDCDDDDGCDHCVKDHLDTCSSEELMAEVTKRKLEISKPDKYMCSVSFTPAMVINTAMINVANGNLELVVMPGNKVGNAKPNVSQHIRF